MKLIYFTNFKKMNLKCKFICFGILIFCLSIGATETSAAEQSDEGSKIIEVELGKINLTLPCHPKLQNSIQSVYDFDWVTDNDIPIFSNGSLSPFLFLESIEPQVEVVNSSLIIYTTPLENATFTCRLTRLHTNYTYIIQATKRSESTRYTAFGRPVSFEKKGETVTLPCVTEKEIASSIAGTSYTWQRMNDKQKSIEVISLNQRILLRNNSANFRVTEDRSLIIPNFIPNYRIHYECHLSTGHYIRHSTAIYDDDTVLPEATKVSVVKRIAVALGNAVTLYCPSAEYRRDFVWMHSDKKFLSIGKSLIKNSEKDNFKFDSDEGSLTIANFSSSFSGIYTCVTSNGPNYVYNVTERKSIFQTIFAEPGKYISLPCSTSSDEGTYSTANTPDSDFIWTRNENEVLFINGRAVTTDSLKIVDDKRSLVITEFSNSLKGVYVCYLTSGIHYTYNVTTSNESNFKNHTIIADYGIRNLVLQCPVINETENASSEWILENALSNNSPSLLFLNKENFVFAFRDYYEIKDDRSLVIKLLTYYTYGVYTCRWSTGEQYVYNVTYEIKLHNHTVWANPGELLTLPCPMEDPKDRELNVINWTIMLPNAQLLDDFRFTDGKMFPKPFAPFTLPNNIKLADDKQSLQVSVSDITSEGDYSCTLIRSNTIHLYSVKVKGT